MQAKIKHWLGNLIAVGVGFFFILAVLEVGLRIFVPQSNVLTDRDSYIGRKLKPHLNMYLQGPGWSSHIWTNKEGWMGHPFAIQKPAHIKRIIHIGDSMTEAIHVNTNKTFVAQSEQKMPGTEQLNLSVAGRGTLLELLTYRHYGSTYDPDVTVLWYHTGNDARDNYFTRDLIQGETVNDVEVQEDRMGFVKTFLLQNFRLPRFIFEKGKNNPFFVGLLVRTGLLSAKPEEVTHADIPLSYRLMILDTPERDIAFATTEKLLTAMKKEVDRGRLVIGLLPSEWEIKPGTDEALKKQYPAMMGKTLEIGYSERRVTQIAQQLSVPLFDASPYLKTAILDGKEPFLQDNGHLNQLGHDIVAREFVKWMQEHRILEQ